jgi:ABC-type antimicrobial peptide transport system permease subunit
MAVRTTTAPAGARAMIESAVREVENSAAISKSATMREILNEGDTRPRFNLLLLGIFSLVAVVLATNGIDGVISYKVAQSTREIGIRLALGAQINDVLRLVVGRGLILTGIGLGIGVAGAFGLTRLLESLLFGVQPHDPLTFLSVTILLGLVAAGACYLPARRATRVDPMVALRYE